MEKASAKGPAKKEPGKRSLEPLLQVRSILKAKKPEFLRQDVYKRKSLQRKWRKPKGMHSKLRQKHAGHPSMVTKGWKSPRAVRGLSPEGLQNVLVHTVEELQHVDKATQIVTIGKVGLKNRLAIVQKAVQLSIKISNIKDPAGYLKIAEDTLRQQRAEKQTKQKEKEQQKKELEKKAAEKKKEETEGIEKAISEEERKELEKQERDKVLTKRE
ncbi:50S ribosomal protein L32e [Candidatus Woesearchaeota archaeon]|nr:50S ribosomal protein L32e [Candidatus Woesearchaeota archaeon]